MYITGKVRIVMLVCIIIGIGILAWWQLRAIIGGPSIRFENLVHGESYTEPFLDITGNARHATFLRINQERVILHFDGSFSFPIILSQGLNTFVIDAQDQFGNRTRQTFLVYGNFPRRTGGQENSPSSEKPLPSIDSPDEQESSLSDIPESSLAEE